MEGDLTMKKLIIPLLAVGLFLITLVIAMIYPVVDIYRGQAYDKIR